MKRLFLELGGKSAAIVLDDADLEGANLDRVGRLHARRARLRDADLDAVTAVPVRRGRRVPAALFGTVTVGDPQLPDTLCGPVISAAERDRILGDLCSGLGARRYRVDRRRPTSRGVDVGYFVRPTLFVDVDNSMRIAREEIFGPGPVVIPYEDDDDAVRIANDNDYGLAGYVLSDLLQRSLGVARRLLPGASGCNGTAVYGAEVPFGGYKASGVGRQNGIAGSEQYLEVKSVAFPAQ